MYIENLKEVYLITFLFREMINVAQSFYALKWLFSMHIAIIKIIHTFHTFPSNTFDDTCLRINIIYAIITISWQVY